MNLSNLIQNVATGSAVILGLTYIVGGLIVNLNLTRRGLVEYQMPGSIQIGISASEKTARRNQ